jgi:hypothetical protein
MSGNKWEMLTRVDGRRCALHGGGGPSIAARRVSFGAAREEGALWAFLLARM